MKGLEDRGDVIEAAPTSNQACCCLKQSASFGYVRGM